MSLKWLFRARVAGNPPAIDLSKIDRLTGGQGIREFTESTGGLGYEAEYWKLKKTDDGTWSLFRNYGAKGFDHYDNLVLENLSLAAGVAALRERSDDLKKEYGGLKNWFCSKRFVEGYNVNLMKAVEQALKQRQAAPAPSLNVRPA